MACYEFHTVMIFDMPTCTIPYCQFITYCMKLCITSLVYAKVEPDNLLKIFSSYAPLQRIIITVNLMQTQEVRLGGTVYVMGQAHRKLHVHMYDIMQDCISLIVYPLLPNVSLMCMLITKR